MGYCHSVSHKVLSSLGLNESESNEINTDHKSGLNIFRIFCRSKLCTLYGHTWHFREVYYFSVIFINFILLSYISVHYTVSAVTRMFNQEVEKKHDKHPEVLI
jgi:hypothetical protein